MSLNWDKIRKWLRLGPWNFWLHRNKCNIIEGIVAILRFECLLPWSNHQWFTHRQLYCFASILLDAMRKLEFLPEFPNTTLHHRRLVDNENRWYSLIYLPRGNFSIISIIAFFWWHCTLSCFEHESKTSTFFEQTVASGIIFRTYLENIDNANNANEWLEVSGRFAIGPAAAATQLDLKRDTVQETVN